MDHATEAWIVLHNPASKRGRSVAATLGGLLERSSAELRRRVRWVDLRKLAEEEVVPARLVAVGGDGTINAAVNWLFSRGLDVPIAIIPAGTGNNLAQGLQLPLDPVRAFEIAVTGESTVALDAVVIGGDDGDPPLTMVQSAALGFPAAIAARYDNLRQHRLFRVLFGPLGPSIYRLLALAGLAAQKRRERLKRGLLELECSLPDETLRETVLAVFLGNERSVGGDFLPCPRARVDDGLLDLCLVRAGTGVSYLRFFRRVARGTHLEFDDTVVYRQSRGPLELRFSEPTPLLVDGDIAAMRRCYRVEVLPGRFRVIRQDPAGAKKITDPG